MRVSVLSSVRIAVFLALAAAAAACGGATSTPTTPSVTPPATTTDAFSGSINQLGSTSYTLAVAATGHVDIELTSVAPLSTMALGLSINAWDGTNCTTTIAQNTNARSGVVALSGTATAGTYCVKVFDSGNIPDASSVSFSLQVVHP